MYMVSSNSGWWSYVDFVVFYYLKNILDQPADVVTSFDSYTSYPWMFKPVYGFLSDSFFPLGYR